MIFLKFPRLLTKFTKDLQRTFVNLVRNLGNFQKIPKYYVSFLDRSKICFVKQLKMLFGHQDRSKISLRIEWEHSQPLRTNLKYRSRSQNQKSMKKTFSKIYMDFWFGTQNDALEWFSEAESVSTPSAVKFCFDLDVRKKY